MKQFCNECIHYKVCKYEDDFSAMISTQSTQEKSSTNNPFTTTVTCKYYKKSEPTPREIELSKDSSTIIGHASTTSKSRNCENCFGCNNYAIEGKN